METFIITTADNSTVGSLFLYSHVSCLERPKRAIAIIMNYHDKRNPERGCRQLHISEVRAKASNGDNLYADPKPFMYQEQTLSGMKIVRAAPGAPAVYAIGMHNSHVDAAL